MPPSLALPPQKQQFLPHEALNQVLQHLVSIAPDQILPLCQTDLLGASYFIKHNPKMFREAISNGIQLGSITSQEKNQLFQKIETLTKDNQELSLQIFPENYLTKDASYRDSDEALRKLMLSCPNSLTYMLNSRQLLCTHENLRDAMIHDGSTNDLNMDLFIVFLNNNSDFSRKNTVKNFHLDDIICKDPESLFKIRSELLQADYNEAAHIKNTDEPSQKKLKTHHNQLFQEIINKRHNPRLLTALIHSIDNTRLLDALNNNLSLKTHILKSEELMLACFEQGASNKPGLEIRSTNCIFKLLRLFGQNQEADTKPIIYSKTIITKLIAEYPKTLQFASDELKRDGEIINFAISRDASVYQYITDKSKVDFEALAKGLHKTPQYVKKLPINIITKPVFVETTLNQYPYLITYLVDRISQGMGGKNYIAFIDLLADAVSKRNDSVLVKNLFEKREDGLVKQHIKNILSKANTMRHAPWPTEISSWLNPSSAQPQYPTTYIMGYPWLNHYF